MNTGWTLRGAIQPHVDLYVTMHTFREVQRAFPYLVSKEIEPKGLSPEETHAKLIDASSKLGLLKLLLPKLRERGHRVLLFSQVSFFGLRLDDPLMIV